MTVEEFIEGILRYEAYIVSKGYTRKQARFIAEYGFDTFSEYMEAPVSFGRVIEAARKLTE